MATQMKQVTVTVTANKNAHSDSWAVKFSSDQVDVGVAGEPERPEKIKFVFSKTSDDGLTFAGFPNSDPSQLPKIEFAPDYTTMTLTDIHTNNLKDVIDYGLFFKDASGHLHSTPDPQIINEPN